MLIIPITNDPNQKLSVLLNNILLYFEVWYQDIGDSWYYSVYDDLQNPIVTGARFASGSPIFATTLTNEAFTGAIIPLPITAEEPELNRNSWGSDHQLIYFNEEELA
jgi:hypothetical protein